MKIILILLFIGFQVHAQKAYTLDECIETALRQRPEIQIQNLQIQQAAATYNFSKRNQYPTVSGNISQGINGGRSIDPFSNSFVQRSISSNSLGVGANWNIFNGFSIRNQIEFNKNNLEQEKLGLALRKKEIKISVIQAFMQVLIAEELLKVVQEQRKDLESQLSALREKEKEGLVSKTQMEDFEAQIANVAYDEYNAKNNIELSKLTLGQWLGFTTKTDFKTKFERTTPSKIVEINPHHPAIKITESKLTGARISTKMAVSTKYPTLNLSGGLGSAYSSAASSEFAYFSQLNYNFNQYFRLGLNIPIFSNGQVQAKTTNARIQEQVLKKQKEQENLRINQEFEKQKMEISLLSEKLKYAEKNLNIQKKAYASAKEQFSEGVINSIELNTFRLNTEKAKISYIQTEIELNLKSLMLEAFVE
jgi:outer membrane protein